MSELERGNNKLAEDEIDLSLILGKVSILFKNILNFFRELLLLVARRWYLLLIAIVAGGVMGYAYYKTIRPFYTSSMTMVLSDIRNDFVQDQLERLSKLVIDGNNHAIAKDLDINVEAAQQIKFLTFSHVGQDMITDDSILIGAPFRVELQLYDSRYFDIMQVAIKKYLENNTYFSNQKQIKKGYLEGIAVKLRKDLASIDSLKINATSLKGVGDGLVYGEQLDPTNMYQQSISMLEKLIGIEGQLKQLNTIEVVVGFTPINNPTGPKAKIPVVAGAVFVFILTLIYLFYLEQKKRKLVVR